MGAGAIGSLYGGLLQHAGHEVTLVSREVHVRAVNEYGLQVHGAYGEYLVRPHAITTPESINDADLVIITTKSYDAIAASRQIDHLVRAGVPILCLQNGLGTECVIAKTLGTTHIMRATTCAGARLNAPGEVTATGMGLTEIGTHYPENMETVTKIADALRAAGFAVNVSDNIEGVVWTKTIVNCGLNPIAALTGLRNGQIYRDPGLRRLVIRLVEEASAVAAALGVTLTTDNPIRYTLGTAKATANNINSMLQDILSGKRTEIDSITGEVVRLGHQHNIETPMNEMVYALVKALETKHLSSRSHMSRFFGFINDEMIDAVYTI